MRTPLPMPPTAYIPDHGWLIDEHLLEGDYRAARDLLINDYAQDSKAACAALDRAHLVHLNATLPPGLEVGEDTEFGGFMYRCMDGECKRSGAHDSPGGAAMYATLHRQGSECRHTGRVRAAVLKALSQRHPDQDHTRTVELVYGHLTPVLAEQESATAHRFCLTGISYGKALGLDALRQRARAEGNDAVARWLGGVDFEAEVSGGHCLRCHGCDDCAPRSAVYEPREYVLTVVRGSQPDANGEELGLSDLANAPLFAGVRSWLEEHEAWENPGSDVWVLVTPAEKDPGQITGLLAQRTVKLGVDLV